MVYATFIVALVFVPLLTLRARRQAVRAARPGLHPRDPGLAGGGADPHAGAVLAAARAASAATIDAAAAGGLAQAALRARAAAHRSAFRARARSGLRCSSSIGASRRCRCSAGVHPRAARGPLHRAHDCGAGHLRSTSRCASARRSRGAAQWPGAVGGAVGRARAERRRHLRHALQRVRGRNDGALPAEQQRILREIETRRRRGAGCAGRDLRA